MKAVRLHAETSTREIIAALLDANVNIVRFVKDLDAEAADWDVTRELAAHFAEEMEKDKDENGQPLTPPAAPPTIGDRVRVTLLGVVKEIDKTGRWLTVESASIRGGEAPFIATSVARTEEG